LLLYTLDILLVVNQRIEEGKLYWTVIDRYFLVTLQSYCVMLVKFAAYVSA